MNKKPEFDWGAEFQQYLDSLDKKTKANLLNRIEAIEDNGISIASQLKWIKLLDGKEGIYKIRFRTGSLFPRALYFRVRNNICFITHGFNKKTNKTPPNEIKRATKFKRQYKKDQGGESL